MANAFWVSHVVYPIFTVTSLSASLSDNLIIFRYKMSNQNKEIEIVCKM